MESANRTRSSEPVRGGPELFKIWTTRNDGGAIIHVSGELDMAACPRLDLAIRDAEERGFGPIVVDLTETVFVDSMALSLLMEARKRSSENGGRLRFLPSEQPSVTRLLEITGTTELLN